MGAWDYGPYDSDDGEDLVDNILEKISKPFTRKRDEKYFYSEMRAAIKIICAIAKSGYLISPELLITAQEKLSKIKNDESYISSWDDEHAIKRELTKELQSVKKLIKASQWT